MTADEVSNAAGPRTGRCSLVILHETEEALAYATSLCERIIAEVWNDLEIDVQQWPFALLSEQTHSAAAVSCSAVADIVVVAAAGEGEFALPFIQWADGLVARRQNYEGVLVGLFAPGTGKEGGASSRDVQLHHLALRAEMDYLNHLPQTPSRGIPDLMEWCSLRAEKLTGTLDQIIRTTPHP